MDRNSALTPRAPNTTTDQGRLRGQLGLLRVLVGVADHRERSHARSWRALRRCRVRRHRPSLARGHRSAAGRLRPAVTLATAAVPAPDDGPSQRARRPRDGPAPVHQCQTATACTSAGPYWRESEPAPGLSLASSQPPSDSAIARLITTRSGRLRNRASTMAPGRTRAPCRTSSQSPASRVGVIELPSTRTRCQASRASTADHAAATAGRPSGVGSKASAPTLNPQRTDHRSVATIVPSQTGGNPCA